MSWSCQPTRCISIISVQTFGRIFRLLLSLAIVTMIGILPSVLSAGPDDKNKESDEKTEWIEIKRLKHGPIKHATLPPDQIVHIREIQQALAEVYYQSVEDWVEGFKKDEHPDSEIKIWESIANGYKSYCGTHELSAEAKKEVFKVALLRSMTSSDEVLRRIDLKHLSQSQAEEIMKSFGEPHPIIITK